MIKRTIVEMQPVVQAYEIVCDGCGKEFIVPKGGKGRKRRSYCSNKCMSRMGQRRCRARKQGFGGGEGI